MGETGKVQTLGMLKQETAQGPGHRELWLPPAHLQPGKKIPTSCVATRDPARALQVIPTPRTESQAAQKSAQHFSSAVVQCPPLSSARITMLDQQAAKPAFLVAQIQQV